MAAGASEYKSHKSKTKFYTQMFGIGIGICLSIDILNKKIPLSGTFWIIPVLGMGNGHIPTKWCHTEVMSSILFLCNRLQGLPPPAPLQLRSKAPFRCWIRTNQWIFWTCYPPQGYKVFCPSTLFIIAETFILHRVKCHIYYMTFVTSQLFLYSDKIPTSWSASDKYTQTIWKSAYRKVWV